MSKIVLAIHGGAGNTPIELSGSNEHPPQLRFMENLLREGYLLLKKSKSALDVVEAMICALEDFPGFNAGRGSALTDAGTVEMDASIMEGACQKVGAVACVKTIKNPISAARLILENTPHNFFVGEAADRFAKQQGLSIEPQHYFITEERKSQLKHIQMKKTENLSQSSSSNQDKVQCELGDDNVKNKFDDNAMGTVGAVVLDANNNLAAGTSTGGKVNQFAGRVGDSPIIGAGTWADDHIAISATGDGEAIMRCCFTHTIAVHYRINAFSLVDSCDMGLEELKKFGEGGCIAINKLGKFAAVFNTRHMYHGWVDEFGEVFTAV